MNKNGQRVTLESRNSVSYSDDKKRSTDASEQIQRADNASKITLVILLASIFNYHLKATNTNSHCRTNR
ncbi:MAG: hypothetical protein ACR5LA_12800 [Wolbachia sp.]